MKLDELKGNKAKPFEKEVPKVLNEIEEMLGSLS